MNIPTLFTFRFVVPGAPPNQNTSIETIVVNEKEQNQQTLGLRTKVSSSSAEWSERGKGNYNYASSFRTVPMHALEHAINATIFPSCDHNDRVRRGEEERERE